MIQSYEDLVVYKMSYSLALRVFHATSGFPRGELYSLTDQVRRSSRSVPVNIAEGWAKRRFENVFKRHLIDAIGSCDETKVWLHIAHDCSYLQASAYQELLSGYKDVGKMLYSLSRTWRTL